MGWDGMGWDGMGWDGMGWDGMWRTASMQGRPPSPQSDSTHLMSCSLGWKMKLLLTLTYTFNSAFPFCWTLSFPLFCSQTLLHSANSFHTINPLILLETSKCIQPSVNIRENGSLLCLRPGNGAKYGKANPDYPVLFTDHKLQCPYELKTGQIST